VSDASSDSTEPAPDSTQTRTDPADLSQMLNRVLASILEGLHLRLELFAIELGEDRRRVVETVIAVLALVFAVFMLLLCVNAALLILLWDTHRPSVGIGSIGFYTFLVLGCAIFLRRRDRNHSEAFAAIRQVLEQDRDEWLRRP